MRRLDFVIGYPYACLLAVIYPQIRIIITREQPDWFHKSASKNLNDLLKLISIFPELLFLVAIVEHAAHHVVANRQKNKKQAAG